MSEKILIIDDEESIRYTFNAFLGAAGYDVEIACTFREGRDRVANLDADVVFVDILLGDGSGIELLREVQARSNFCPVVMITGQPTLETAADAIRLGAFDYLAKPIRKDELLRVADRALRHKAIQDENEAYRAHLDAVFNSVGDALITVDREKKLIGFNPAAGDLFGLQHDFIGRAIGAVPARVPTEILALIQEVNETGVGRKTESVEWCAEGVKTRQLSVTTGLLVNRNGMHLGSLVVTRDETDRRALESELLRIRNLESLGILAGGIAHDYNNLLTVILGNIQLSASLAAPDSQQQRSLMAAESASQQARKLTRQFRAFAGGGAAVRKVMSIGDMLRDVGSFLLSGTSIRCNFSIAENLWFTEVDEEEIRQAIQNLVLNAREAMPGGGIFTVAAGNTVIPGGRQPHLAEGHYVQIDLSDTGAGIAPEDLPKVFDPYFSTKPRGTDKGMGLGLSICHSVVRKHKGDLSIRSMLGKGTTVTMFLPATTMMPVIETPVQRQAEPVRSYETGRILVMDDEPLIAALAADILAQLGYEIETVGDGQEAIACYERAAREEKPFAAVLLDLTVPGGMGGIETVERLQKLAPDVKAVISSGHSNHPVFSDHRAFGFEAALLKPYTMKALAETIRKVVGE